MIDSAVLCAAQLGFVHAGATANVRATPENVRTITDDLHAHIHTLMQCDMLSPQQRCGAV